MGPGWEENAGKTAFKDAAFKAESLGGTLGQCETRPLSGFANS